VRRGAALLLLALAVWACDYQPRPGSRAKVSAERAAPVPGVTAIPTPAAPAAGDCAITLAVQGMT